MNEVTIKHVTANDVKKMTDIEGLVLQDCGGDPREWVNGMNRLFIEENILQKGDAFKEIYVFEHDGNTNILLSMKNVRLDLGTLAIWRVETHDVYGGTWLSDYLPDRLGVRGKTPQATSENPEMSLAGMDGNIFAILGNAAKLLKQFGRHDQIEEMYERVFSALVYSDALMIVSEYVQTELSRPLPEPDKIPEPDHTAYKLVYICAPLRGDVERNVEAARLFAKEVFDAGDISVCPHLMFPPIADPKDVEQDAKALAMCLNLIESCHQVNAYGPPTEGMRAEIAHAKRMGIPVHEIAPAKSKEHGDHARGNCR